MESSDGAAGGIKLRAKIRSSDGAAGGLKLRAKIGSSDGATGGLKLKAKIGRCAEINPAGGVSGTNRVVTQMFWHLLAV